MSSRKTSQSEYSGIITVKITDDFKRMLQYLQEQTMLNRSSVIRYAVVEFYRANGGNLHEFN